MATASVPHRWKYDVFVSFRGEDIRKSFMDHLFNDFKQKGIRAFRDYNDLPKGEEIFPELHAAIETSRFLIVIFSKNYVTSSWCLRELVKIFECKKIEDPKHEVRMIFYDVKPDMLRKQKWSYAEDFCKREISNNAEVGKWKEALSMAADVSGFDLQDMTNGYEYKFIDCISKDILKKLCDGPLHVGENLVGIDDHFDKLDLSRFVGSHKVNMIGICGISGIGKTTLAKAIYNLMYLHYEGSCFCDDVQEVEKRQGLTQVQTQMIGKIMKTEDLKISSVGEGTMVIKQRMACKSILLVLDNVNNVEQLEALADSPDWFFPGSLIIFTAKDKQLLKYHTQDGIYDMENLGYDPALELFSLYAFGKKESTKDFEDITYQVIIHLQGHPLALKVIGRSLYEKSVHFWNSELERLQTYPNSDILQKLQPSFNGLASDQKIMFLDIACAFIGEKKYFAASVLDSSRSANSIIEVLADKFLITVSADRLQMHELIQSMAREIICEEFRQNHRSLWISKEHYNLLNENQVREEVEVLALLLHKNCQNMSIDGQALAQMKNLRILKVLQPFAVNFSGRLDFLSNKLRLLYWHGMPLKFLPSGFYPENIVAVDLSYSHIQHLWTTPMCLRSLKVMKLRYCRNLTTTPDFSEIINLEELDIEGCVNLVTLHPSIGMLKTLVVLNMRDCIKARSFPSKVEMDSLQVLNLSGCSNVNQVRDAFWSRWWSSIPGFIWNQQHSQISLSLAGFHMLKSLNFSYCNLVQVPDAIGDLLCLEDLNLKGNNFTCLPGSLSQLSHLRKLRLDGCKKLEVLLELPHSLKTIEARGCTSLCSITGSNPIMTKRSSYLSNCPKLFKKRTIGGQVSIVDTERLNSSVTSQGSTNRFSSFLGYARIQNNRCGLFRLPQISSIENIDMIYNGNGIPNWFTYKSIGNHLKVELPSDWSFSKLRGYGIYIVFKRKKPSAHFGYTVENFDGAYLGRCDPFYYREYFSGKPIGIDESDMIWLHYTTKEIQKLKEAKNFVKFCFNEKFEVKKMGVRFFFDQDSDQEVDLNMFEDLPTLSKHGGALCLFRDYRIDWSW